MSEQLPNNVIPLRNEDLYHALLKKGRIDPRPHVREDGALIPYQVYSSTDEVLEAFAGRFAPTGRTKDCRLFFVGNVLYWEDYSDLGAVARLFDAQEFGTTLYLTTKADRLGLFAPLKKSLDKFYESYMVRVVTTIDDSENNIYGI